MLAICHTSYSLQAGVRSPEEWVSAAVDRGYTALAVADVNGLFGAVQFYRAAEEAGLRPVVGAELYWDGGSPVTALVRCDQGYRNLCRVLSDLHLDPGFDLFSYPPTRLSGLCFFSRSRVSARELAARVGAGNVFLLPRGQSWHLTDRDALWESLTSCLTEAPLADAWFLCEQDRETAAWLRLLRERGGGRCGPGDMDHPGHILEPATLWSRQFPDAERVSRQFLDQVQFRFEFGIPRIPQISLPSGTGACEHLRVLCESRLGTVYSGDRFRVARERLAHEIRAICESGFADYFLFVREIIGFAQQHRIPVEVRGSAASSIVSYLLGFTHCCPLENELLFERFMNPGRRDWPDIDVDIADSRRDEVIRFCYERWGEDRVAMIATIPTYRVRSAVRDAARLLGLSQESVTRFLDHGVTPPCEHELVRISSRLTGLPRHVGVHCGGLVITPGPLTDFTPLMRAAKGIVITQYEKDQAEAIGLVKMDLLGNSALSVIDEACRWIRRCGGVFTEPGPAYDFKVRRLFSCGDTLGVYQCESPGMRQLCQALTPGTRPEVANALSLIRPGPAAAGMKEAFIRRRRGVEAITYRHPAMAEFLGGTYGVMLFQEDVMKVAVHLAGYSLGDADVLRRAAKHRDSEAFAEERHRFVFEKAADAGVEPAAAEEIWQLVSQFAGYAYCKAHASVYSRLAWLTARLKAHFPLAFYTALLNRHSSMYPKRVFVWDAMRHGIPVLPVDVTCSGLDWMPTRRGIRAGLSLVKGVRHSVCRDIVREQHRTPFQGLADLRSRVLFQAGELERLILVGACRAFGTRALLLRELSGEKRSDPRQPVLAPLFMDVQRNRDEEAIPSLLECECLLTGIPFCAHPAANRSAPEKARLVRAVDMGAHLRQDVWMEGIMDACKVLQAKGREGRSRASGADMSFVTLEDATGLFELVLFPRQHQRFSHLFTHMGPYRVQGVVTEAWDALSLEVHYVEAVG